MNIYDCGVVSPVYIKDHLLRIAITRCCISDIMHRIHSVRTDHLDVRDIKYRRNLAIILSRIDHVVDDHVLAV